MKLAQIQVTGMNRDMAMSKFEPQLTYENKNIRIHYNKNELFAGSVSNEAGNKLVYTAPGTIIGYAVYQEYIILFLKDSYIIKDNEPTFKNAIYKLAFDGEKIADPIILYSTKKDILSWEKATYLETLVYEEDADTIKVYWVDGINQLRSLNIAPNESYSENYSFDSLPKINKFGIFTVKKAYGGGEFPAGTIQYCATYINDNKAESNIIWQSPLYYIAFADRAGKPNEVVNAVFNIRAEDLDFNFKFLRLFSIIRTSTDTTPKIKCLGEFDIQKNEDSYYVEVTDFNTTGYDIDTYELLYKNRRYIIPKSLAQKDNTLFLGNFQYSEHTNETITPINYSISSDRKLPLQTSGFCYESVLNKTNEDITYLKDGEVYYLGYQLQDQYGWWTPPIYLGTYSDLFTSKDNKIIEGNKEIVVDGKNKIVYLPTPEINFKFENSTYKRIRPIISYPNYFEYNLIAQGPLFPTIFNPEKRKKGIAYAEHSWYSRPQIDHDVLDTTKWQLTFPECYQLFPGGDSSPNPMKISEAGFIASDASIYREDYLFGKNPDIFKNADFLNHEDWLSLNNKGTWAEFRHYWPLPSMWHKNCEIDGSAYYWSYSNASAKKGLFTNPSVLRNNYYVDRSIVTLHSPDIILNQYSHGYLDDCYFNIIGDMKLSSFYHDIDIIHKQTTPLMSWIYKDKLNVEKVVGKGPGLYKPGIQAVDSDDYGWKLGLAGGFWIDAPVKSNRKYNHNKHKWFYRSVGELGYFMYTLYPFQKGGCLNENILREADDKGNNKQEASSYSWKRTSNLRIANVNTYINKYKSENKLPIYIFNSDVDAVLRIKTFKDDLVAYRGNQNITNFNIIGASLQNSENAPMIWTGSANRKKSSGDCWWVHKRNFILFPDDLEELTTQEKLVIKNEYFGTVDLEQGIAQIPLIKVEGNSDATIIPGSKIIGVECIINEGDSFDSIFQCRVVSENFAKNKINTYSSDLGYPANSGKTAEADAARTTLFLVKVVNDTEYTIGNHKIKFNIDTVTNTYYLPVGILIGMNAENTGGDIPEEARKITYVFGPTLCTISEVNNNVPTLILSDQDTSVVGNKELYFNIGNLKNGDWLNKNLVKEFDENMDSGIITGSAVMSSGKIGLGFRPEFSEQEAFNSMSRSLTEIYYNVDSRPTVAAAKPEFIGEQLINYTTGIYDAPCSSEATQIKAKSTAHAVINLECLKETGTTAIPILPIKGYSDNKRTLITVDSYNNTSDDSDLITYTFKNLFTDNAENRSYGYYYIGEIKKIPHINTAEDAIQNRTWNIGGAAVDIDSSKLDGTTISFTAGDFYYQRFDCLNTQEWGQHELNGNVEIISFMCESRFNLDGRYDTNRSTPSNIYANDNNFNLFNLAYTQQNNYFSYFIDKHADRVKYPNYITWTLTKTNGEEIDSWSKIDSVATLQLDGQYGDITAIKKWNNEIVAFQELGIAQVLYNSRTVVAPSQGVPLEVANSGKVDGKTYLSTAMGCLDKRLIADSGNTLYFVDSYKNDLWSLSAQGPVPISQTKGFYSWTQNNTIKKVFYTQNKKDIWFNTEKTTLAYSEVLDQFVSFYDYHKSEHVINILGESIACTSTKLYLQNAGDPCNFFGEQNSYYIDMVVKDEGYVDKVFDNIEFRGEAHQDNDKYNICPFNKIQVFNEYQNSGSIDLILHKNLEQKFRIWRANIPRDASGKKGRIKNRIRSPWARIKLSNEIPINTQGSSFEASPHFLIHDFIIYYTD